MANGYTFHNFHPSTSLHTIRARGGPGLGCSDVAPTSLSTSESLFLFFVAVVVGGGDVVCVCVRERERVCV